MWFNGLKWSKITTGGWGRDYSDGHNHPELKPYNLGDIYSYIYIYICTLQLFTGHFGTEIGGIYHI